MPITGKMYRYALSIVRDPETAHDVVQDCLARIWQKRKMLPEINNVDSWVMRIVRNHCYDWVKVNRYNLRNKRHPENEGLSLSGSVEADQSVLLNDQLKWLDKVISSLPEKQREIYYLREVEEMTYQEIAGVMSLTLGEVKINLHRTRRKIREMFKKIQEYGLAN